MVGKRRPAPRSNVARRCPGTSTSASPMRYLLWQVAAHAQNMLRCRRGELFLRHFSRAAASSLPPNLAAQVDEFNREMEALFGLHENRDGALGSEYNPANSQPFASGTAAAPLSCSSAATPASPGPPARIPVQELNRIEVQELNRIEVSIDAAYTSGALSDRERRYLSLMLRNSDQQLLRLAATNGSLVTTVSLSPPAAAASPPSLPAHALLQVLDERISHSLLQQYGQ